ncbi:histidine phosphatase family protein [Parvularcula flava]|uniref:Histidine phosphatase family protein n=1 Tax=Aquisalinus luteolus TaxID=1566827 RepID=A0A8J3A3F7_9PROT|nr:phosphoglycerate mutase family protein [Aquisalinus luteolus]NHK29137.1 histidine phosphatase family protein [Aquisalinus luteolus]GGI00194.1 hypothetical protein GCM10011355_27910 [Aquisalinus luteolus]
MVDLIKSVFSVLTAFFLSALITVGAQPVPVGADTILLLRHAEAGDGNDPALTAKGKARAERVANQLAGLPIRTIYVTDTIRARQTAEPLANRLDLDVSPYDPFALPAFAEALKMTTGPVLVVGHSNTTPELVRLLGGEAGEPIAHDEHDRLYRVANGETELYEAGGAPLAMAGCPEAGATIESLIVQTYAVISGPAGEKRDWACFRSLFADGAQMMALHLPDQSPRVLMPQEYIERSGPWLEENGFFEKEVGRTVHQYGGIAQVFSSYEAVRSADDAEPFMRGINSFQLVRDANGWKITSLVWQQEHDGLPVPKAYLGTE